MKYLLKKKLYTTNSLKVISLAQKYFEELSKQLSTNIQNNKNSYPQHLM